MTAMMAAMPTTMTTTTATIIITTVITIITAITTAAITTTMTATAAATRVATNSACSRPAAARTAAIEGQTSRLKDEYGCRLFKPLASLARLLAGFTAAADGGVRQAASRGDSAPAPAASGTDQQAGMPTSSPAKRDASPR